MPEQKYKGISTPDRLRPLYLRKSWYKDPNNFWWRDGFQKQELVDRMNEFAENVAKLESGCLLKIIPDNE